MPNKKHTYTHLETKSTASVPVAGFKLHSKIMFTYGNISIDAEVTFPESESNGTILLYIYREDKAAGLPGGELPGDTDELELLNKILPAKDISYILSLFGLHRPGDAYKNRRRTRIETPRARKFKFFDRIELMFSQRVDEAWLQSNGAMTGYTQAN